MKTVAFEDQEPDSEHGSEDGVVPPAEADEQDPQAAFEVALNRGLSAGLFGMLSPHLRSMLVTTCGTHTAVTHASTPRGAANVSGSSGLRLYKSRYAPSERHVNWMDCQTHSTGVKAVISDPSNDSSRASDARTPTQTQASGTCVSGHTPSPGWDIGQSTHELQLLVTFAASHSTTSFV